MQVARASLYAVDKAIEPAVKMQAKRMTVIKTVDLVVMMNWLHCANVLAPVRVHDNS